MLLEEVGRVRLGVERLRLDLSLLWERAAGVKRLLLRGVGIIFAGVVDRKRRRGDERRRKGAVGRGRSVFASWAEERLGRLRSIGERGGHEGDRLGLVGWLRLLYEGGRVGADRGEGGCRARNRRRRVRRLTSKRRR